MAEDLHRFTIEELARCNGENGAPAYVAYEGRVFDVSASRLWRGGTHMKRHAAGADLSAELSAAPHDSSVLERFPQVGVLVREESPAIAGTGPAVARTGAAVAGAGPAAGPVHSNAKAGLMPAWLARFLERHPFFRRHPHPMTVHFPIVFMIAAPIFTIMYLATGFPGFELTAFNCLGAGVLFCLVVIPTGLFTWWLNYGAAPLPAVTVKLVVSILMLFDGLAAFLWRLIDPAVIVPPRAPPALYLILVFLLLPMVVVVAWFGATLTFPLRGEKGAKTRGAAG